MLLDVELEEMGKRLQHLQRNVDELMVQAGITKATEEQMVRPWLGDCFLCAEPVIAFILKTQSHIRSLWEFLPLYLKNLQE